MTREKLVARHHVLEVFISEHCRADLASRFEESDGRSISTFESET